jgi:hypothetical protein
MTDSLFDRYGITGHEPNPKMIEMYNDAVRGFMPASPEELEARKKAHEEWMKKSKFEREFRDGDGWMRLGEVFAITLSDDQLSVTAEERCDNYHNCPMTKAEFQRLIDAMQNLCNKMKP